MDKVDKKLDSRLPPSPRGFGGTGRGNDRMFIYTLHD